MKLTLSVSYGIGVLMQTDYDDGGKNLWLKLNADALSSSLLILARVVQGIGGAMTGFKQIDPDIFTVHAGCNYHLRDKPHRLAFPVVDEVQLPQPDSVRYRWCPA